MRYLNLIAIFLLGVYQAELQPLNEETDASDEIEVDLTDEDFENAKHLNHSDYKFDENAIIDDIIEDSDEPTTAFAKRAVLSDRNLLWPNATVPYKVDWTWLRHEKAMIAETIQLFNNSTCVRWVPQVDETDYVFFDESMRCSSWVGRKGGRQKINLYDYLCINVHSILHEMMHTIGFEHEHNRPDRNKHVRIHWNNMKDDNRTRRNFTVKNGTVSLDKYDFNSIMHYSAYADTDRGLPTIEAKKWRGSIGGTGTFSPLDIKKIGLLYQCTPPSLTTPASS